MRAGNSLNALQRFFLGKNAGDIGCNARPEVCLAITREVAPKDYAPVRIAGAKAQAAKGDGHQRHPSVARHLTLRVPNLVITVILAKAFGPRRIGLHARRIYREENAFPAVLKGIEQHRHVVVVEHILAPRQMSANQVRMVIVADEYEIQGALCIPQPDLGFFGRRLAVAGRVLNETGDMQQLAFQLRPGLHARKVREPQAFSEQGHAIVAPRLSLGSLRRSRRRFIALFCRGV